MDGSWCSEKGYTRKRLRAAFDGRGEIYGRRCMVSSVNSGGCRRPQLKLSSSSHGKMAAFEMGHSNHAPHNSKSVAIFYPFATLTDIYFRPKCTVEYGYCSLARHTHDGEDGMELTDSTFYSTSRESSGSMRGGHEEHPQRVPVATA